MSEYIVALSVDKVQTFLTEVIHSHVQEKEAEEETLRQIINSSDQISKDFFKSVCDQFPEAEKNTLMKCSGVFIFRSILSEEKLEKNLNDLFVQYYRQSNGQKLLRWTYFPAGNMDNLIAIQKAKKELKSAKSLNRIIEKNQGTLFTFQDVVKMDGENYTVGRNKVEFSAFVENVNALRIEKENDGTRFRIAVLKADLDGMGKMFREINNESEYTKISEILNSEISLKGLHRAACKYAPDARPAWMFPLYIAGDDIFFAVAIEDMIRGINVCRELMQSVNKEIEECGISNKRLGVSVGVEITFNKEPIRYYMERVETQLKCAKKCEVPSMIKECLIMKISICNLVFFYIDEKKKKEEQERLKKNKKARKKAASEIDQQLQSIPVWNYFVHDVKFLNHMRNTDGECSRLLGQTNFFYTLLEDITDETVQKDNVKYINHVLYHLEPKYFDHPDRQLQHAELILNYKILKQLYYRDNKGFKIVLDEKMKMRFETYLRLLLLFTDIRFQIFTDKTEDLQIRDKQKAEIKRILFSKPRQYLYEHCLRGKAPELTEVFAKEISMPEAHKKGYQKISLERSAFFRLRTLKMEELEKAADIIEIHNPATEDEKEKIAMHNEERMEKGNLPNRLYFDRDKMIKTAGKSGAWTSDYIDSLMLFFSYNEMFIKFKN